MRVRLQTTSEQRDPGASGPATTSPVDAADPAELERRAATALARVRSTYRGRPRALIQRAIRTALADAVGGALTVPDLVRAATGIHHGHFVTVYVQPAVGRFRNRLRRGDGPVDERSQRARDADAPAPRARRERA